MAQPSPSSAQEVQPEVLSTLTQYYDPPLRCFTFRDFQLAPTLEEYDRLIGMTCHESPPYLFGGHYPSWATVARLFKVPKSVRLQQLQEEGDWLTFVDVYGLLVYGIVLFPHIECYVDLAAIDAFLGKRDKGEHPVVIVLANTYYTLDYCSRKKGKGLRCCTSLLFLWLTAHLFHSGKRMKCPIEDHYWSCVKPLTKSEWTAHLDEATERTIRRGPRFETIEEESVGLQRPLKRKCGKPDSRQGEGRFEEREFEDITRAKGLRELERDQALLEKEELTTALEDARSREGSAKDQIRQLREQIDLLKAEVVGHRLSNEYLERQKRKTADSDLPADAAIQKFKEQTSKYLEIADHAEKAAWEAREEAQFWKDRFIKLAWLANQTIKDIPANLRMAKGMVNPLNTPRKVIQFLSLCRNLYEEIKALASPP
ncbi:hypothetical protein CR513_47591, partial [Mucuna pruriens]